MGKWERKFGKYAIPRLTMVLLVINALGYLFLLTGREMTLYFACTLNPGLVLQGQVWRLVTWLMIPYSPDLFRFALIAVLFYLPIGTQMENVWGRFRYNVYIFSGLLFTVIGAFLLYGYLTLAGGMQAATDNMALLAITISPYFVMLSIFFAFAVTYPDNMVLFMFLIPLKMKWLGLAYGAMILWEIINGNIASRTVIIASLLNFALFYMVSMRDRTARKRFGNQEIRRQQAFHQQSKMAQRTAAMHRCAICGATPETHPDYEFRYCSKCNGAYEYCQEHLFTHTHIQ